MLTAIVGINWGDEGKGRMVDLLSAEYDIVARYQGGNNAGHTVVNDRGKFILNLLPSGILRDETLNIMGGGMVIDLEHLVNEISTLKAQGIDITPDRLVISDKATVCLPYHRLLDGLEEDRLADRKFGSTRRGIAPVYADKFMKKTLRMSDLRNPERTREKLRELCDWKNIVLRGYNAPEADAEALYKWVCDYGTPLLEYVRDTTKLLNEAMAEDKRIMFEAQLGALRDIEYGIYPYTSSSTTLAAYAPIGSGIPAAKLDCVIGIMKAYSSCVGEGPFVCEFFGDEAEELRRAGGEFGAATGRPRRVGGFDIPASRYGVTVQGATELALTKLDVLSGLDKIPVCVAYEVNGVRTIDFPSTDEQENAKPVYEYLPGFSGDITICREFSDLPKEAQDYVRYIEKVVGCPITYVSVGAGRDEYIKM